MQSVYCIYEGSFYNFYWNYYLFVYYNWSLIKNNASCIKFNTHKETQIWWMQHITGGIKTNIKNRAYFFYNDIIDLDEFDGSKTKVDKKSFNGINIYSLGYKYKKKNTECNEINSVNPLYLRIAGMKGQF